MSWQLFLIILSISGLLVYIHYALLFYRGIILRDEKRNFGRLNVSIVVAARNEEHNISSLLTSLLNQTYPLDMFEVIIANDESTDATEDIIKQFQQKWDNLKYINVLERGKAASPKKNALSQAIENATGELILLTDADCVPGKDWVESMVAHFTEDISMVVGFSKTRIVNWKKATLVQKFEYFDFNSMFFAAAGSIAQHKYFSCSGQNLAYRKDAFLKVGGFSKIRHLISGDDVNLMQLMGREGLKIRFAFSPASFMTTGGISNWGQLLNQRSRWASNMKWQFKLNPEFFFYLISVLIATFLPIIMLFIYPWLAVAMLISKWVFEIRLIKLGFKIFHLKKNRLNFYPTWVLLQPFYMIIVAVFGFFELFRWKR